MAAVSRANFICRLDSSWECDKSPTKWRERKLIKNLKFNLDTQLDREVCSSGRREENKRASLPKIPGTRQKQFVSIAPCTTSTAGRTLNASRHTPITYENSTRQTNPNSCARKLRKLLKKHNLADRRKTAISGAENAITIAQIHAIISRLDVSASNFFSGAEKYAFSMSFCDEKSARLMTHILCRNSASCHSQ